jgi:hypothetical protein
MTVKYLLPPLLIVLGVAFLATAGGIYFMKDVVCCIPGIHFWEHSGVELFGISIGSPGQMPFLLVCLALAMIGTTSILFGCYKLWSNP